MFDTDQLKQFSKSTLKDETATDEEKTAASQALQRLRAAKKTKAEITETCGKKPKRKSFPNEEDYRAAMSTYWDLLDRRAVRREAERVLNDRNSTPVTRLHARQRIDALEGRSPQPENEADEKKASKSFPTREDFGFKSGHDWPEFVASGKEAEFQAALAKWCETAPPPSDPKLAAFLNALTDESVKVTRPAAPSVTPKVPIVPTTDLSLYCEHCGLAFKSLRV